MGWEVLILFQGKAIDKYVLTSKTKTKIMYTKIILNPNNTLK